MTDAPRPAAWRYAINTALMGSGSRREGAATPLDEHRALIALCQVTGIGPARVRALMERFGTAAAVLGASPRAMQRVPGIGAQTAEAIAAEDHLGWADAQIGQAERLGATLYTFWDATYPEKLRQLYDPPILLWALGTLIPEDAHAVAIVGTRRASPYGLDLARAFSAALARRGFTVVSGLAAGIDGAAHQGALDAGGRTVAVLGSGLDRVYPSKHIPMGRAIARQGALVSEYPFFTKPDAANFPKRNRIISGMTAGTLIVEAFESGGALITARMALAQNREVFAIPGPIQRRSAAGCHRLIQQGYAKLVLDVEDILDEIGGAPDQGERPPPAPPRRPLNRQEQALIEALGTTPVHLDQICTATGMEVSGALVALLRLEFDGFVGQLAGMHFFKTPGTA